MDMVTLFAFFLFGLVGIGYRYYCVDVRRKSLGKDEVLVRPSYTALNFPNDELIVNGRKVRFRQPQFDMPTYATKIGDEISTDLPIYDQPPHSIAITSSMRGKEVILRHRNHNALVANLVVLVSLIFGQELLAGLEDAYIGYWLFALVLSGLLQIGLYFISNPTIIEVVDQHPERFATNA